MPTAVPSLQKSQEEKDSLGSAGMIGKSSGAGKCVNPKVCQSTMSLSAMGADGSAAIQSGRDRFCGLVDSPEVCGLVLSGGLGGAFVAGEGWWGGCLHVASGGVDLVVVVWCFRSVSDT